MLLAQSTLWQSASAARGAQASLAELHACIVAADDALDAAHGSVAAALLAECRAWCRAAQAFVLGLSKQMQAFGGSPGDASLASADALSSMEEGCSTSSGPSSAAGLAAWRATCGDAADALTAVVAALAGGGAEVGRAARRAAAQRAGAPATRAPTPT